MNIAQSQTDENLGFRSFMPIEGEVTEKISLFARFGSILLDKPSL
jgi:hypothetical protein